MVTKLNYDVQDNDGVTTIVARDGEGEEAKKLKSLSVPTPVFDALTEISEPTSNKEVQAIIAAAAGWPLNKKGGSAKAAALLERCTHGYKQFNGLISLMVGTSEGSRRFFHFNESLAPESGAQMLTRQKKEETESE